MLSKPLNILKTSIRSPRNLITRLAEVCRDYGMQINIKKTKAMVISKTRNVPCKIVIDGSQLEQVSQYKYLGTWMTEDVNLMLKHE